MVQIDLEPSPSSRPGFLGRLSAWLRPWKRRDDGTPEDLLHDGPPVGGSASAELTWPRRRASQVSRLEEAFDKVASLIDTIDRHMQSQAERSEQMLAQTRRIADAAAQNQGLERQQTEAIEQLTDQFRGQTRQMQQVADSVEALPRAIKGQADQLGRMHDQLEAQLEAQLSTAQGVQQMAGHADLLRSLADEQRRQFLQLQESNQGMSLELAKAMERQSRRTTWLLAFALAASLGAAVAAAMLWFVSRRGG